jgi:protein-disulfide isomerase
MKKLIALLIVLMAAGATQAQKVKVVADPAADLSRYKSYQWDKPLPPGNPLVQQAIIASIEQAMAAKGLTKLTDGADVTVVYFTAVNADIQIGYPSWSNAMGSGDMTGMAVGTQSWPVHKGTLVVDLVDGKSKNSVWRGTAQQVLKDGPSGNITKDAKKVEQPIRKSIEKMFNRFPKA